MYKSCYAIKNGSTFTLQIYRCYLPEVLVPGYDTGILCTNILLRAWRELRCHGRSKVYEVFYSETKIAIQVKPITVLKMSAHECIIKYYIATRIFNEQKDRFIFGANVFNWMKTKLIFLVHFTVNYIVAADAHRIIVFVHDTWYRYQYQYHLVLSFDDNMIIPVDSF